MAPIGSNMGTTISASLTILFMSSVFSNIEALSVASPSNPAPPHSYPFGSDEQNGADSVGAVIRKYPHLKEPLPHVNYSMREQQSMQPEHNDSLNGLMLSSVLAAPMANYELAAGPANLPGSSAVTPESLADIDKRAETGVERVVGLQHHDSSAKATAMSAPIYDTVTGAVFSNTAVTPEASFVPMERGPEDHINDLLIGANYTVVKKRSVGRRFRRHPAVENQPIRKVRHYKREVGHCDDSDCSEDDSSENQRSIGQCCMCCRKSASVEEEDEEWDCSNFYPLYPWDHEGARQYYYSSSNKYVVPREQQPKIAVRPLLPSSRKTRASICSYQKVDDLQAVSHYGCCKRKRQSLPAVMDMDHPEYIDFPVAIAKRREIGDGTKPTTAAIYWNPPARKERPQTFLQRGTPEKTPGRLLFSGQEPAPVPDEYNRRMEKARQDAMLRNVGHPATKSPQGGGFAQAKTLWKMNMKQKVDEFETPAGQSSPTTKTMSDELSIQRIPIAFGADSKEAAFIEAIFSKNKYGQDHRLHEPMPSLHVVPNVVQERPQTHAATVETPRITHSHYDAMAKTTTTMEESYNVLQAQQTSSQDGEELLPVGTILFNIFGKKKDAELIYNNKLNQEGKASGERAPAFHAKSAEFIQRGPGMDSGEQGGGLIAKMQALLQDALKTDQASEGKLPTLYVKSQVEGMKNSVSDAMTPTHTREALPVQVTGNPMPFHEHPSTRATTSPVPRTRDSALKTKSTLDMLAKSKHMSMLRAVLCGNACTPSADRFGKMRKTGDDPRWTPERRYDATSTAPKLHSSPYTPKVSLSGPKVESVSALEKILMKAAHMDTVDSVQLKEGRMDPGQQTRTKRKGIREEVPYVFDTVAVHPNHQAQRQLYEILESIPHPQNRQTTKAKPNAEKENYAVPSKVVWVLDKKMVGEESSSEEKVLIPDELRRESHENLSPPAEYAKQASAPELDFIQLGHNHTHVMDPMAAYKEVLHYWRGSTPKRADADDVTAPSSSVGHDDMLRVVERGSAPYHALIDFRGHFACGGTILHNLWIITAASCIPDANPELYKVFVGKVSKNEVQPIEQIHLVASVVVHENYTNPKNGNDLALLLLHRPIEFNSFVEPAQLPQVDKEPMPGQALTLTGFGGKLPTDPGSDGFLKTTIAAYISDWECEFVLSENYSAKRILNIRPSQLCAIGMHGIASPGDPLVTKTTHTLVGIVSFKVPVPGKENYPIVYTQVSHFLPWIGLKMATEVKRPKSQVGLRSRIEALLN